MMKPTTDDFASFDLDDTDERLAPAADAIRDSIRHQYNVSDEQTIIVYGVEAWVPDERFVAHVYIEDEDGNDVTDKYDFGKQYRSLDEMEPLSDKELDMLKQLHNDTS